MEIRAKSNTTCRRMLTYASSTGVLLALLLLLLNAATDATAARIRPSSPRLPPFAPSPPLPAPASAPGPAPAPAGAFAAVSFGSANGFVTSVSRPRD